MNHLTQGLVSHVKASGFYSKSTEVSSKGLGEEKAMC